VGILPNPLEALGSVWVSYLRVASPADIASKVGALGGHVIIEAQARSIGGEVAFVAGPSGAGIALQTWPLEQED
jgi:predicted enzyme related to lactoylglutathione lyase